MVGAATSIAELAQALDSEIQIPSDTPSSAAKPSSAGAGGTSAPAPPFAALAATLRRVAGSHVRNAATVGGNLCLAR